MAKTNANRYKKKKKKTPTVQYVVFLILAIVFLLTYNTIKPFTDALPTWNTILGENDTQNQPLDDIPEYKHDFILTDYDVSVHVIDVGQGSSTLVLADDKAMLIDAGDNGAQDVILEYLNKYNITQLEYVVASHPHADHIGGMSYVLDQLEVKNIIMPEIPESIIPTTKTYERLLTSIVDNDVNVIKAEPNSEYSLGKYSFFVLSPVKEYQDLNDISAAIRLVFNEVGVLVAGDIEKEAEEDILNSGQNLNSDIMTLAHHGSYTSNTIEFLTEIGAKYYVAQVGYRNDYGHPHEQVYNSVMQLNGEFLRSDIDGHIVFGINDNIIEVITQK